MPSKSPQRHSLPPLAQSRLADALAASASVRGASTAKSKGRRIPVCIDHAGFAALNIPKGRQLDRSAWRAAHAVVERMQAGQSDLPTLDRSVRSRLSVGETIRVRRGRRTSARLLADAGYHTFIDLIETPRPLSIRGERVLADLRAFMWAAPITAIGTATAAYCHLIVNRQHPAFAEQLIVEISEGLAAISEPTRFAGVTAAAELATDILTVEFNPEVPGHQELLGRFGSVWERHRDFRRARNLFGELRDVDACARIAIAYARQLLDIGMFNDTIAATHRSDQRASTFTVDELLAAGAAVTKPLTAERELVDRLAKEYAGPARNRFAARQGPQDPAGRIMAQPPAARSEVAATISELFADDARAFRGDVIRRIADAPLRTIERQAPMRASRSGDAMSR